jgi:proteasome lid subunit RPN8/RPN11
MAPESIHIPDDVWTTMLDHVISCLPEEACGLLGGTGSLASLVLPVANVAGSSTRFQMEPRGQIEAMTRIEQAGLDLVAIYHSHPGGPLVPSETDLREAAYPESAYLIWSPGAVAWECRAFRIGPQGAKAMAMVSGEGGTPGTVRGLKH